MGEREREGGREGESVRFGTGRQGGGDEAVQLVVGGAGMVSSLHQPNLYLLGSSRLISGDCNLAPASAARQSSRAPRRSCRTRGRRAAARAPTLGQSGSNFWASSRSALGELSLLVLCDEL